jgi:hypothetical protein
MKDAQRLKVRAHQGRWMALLLLSAVVASGCHTQTIPNTTIEDNRENREVIEFCEGYRRALEQRDVGALLAMTSPRYYENGGTPEGADDYDIDGLREVLSRTLPRLQAVRYEFRYRRVAFERDRVFVDYTYSGSFRIEADEGPQWFRRVADNRLELERVGGQYRIVAGM